MITSISEALGGASTTTVYAILLLAGVQLALQAWALIDLARRRTVRFDKKWIWIAVILVLSNAGIGAIAYLAWGRRVPESVDMVDTGRADEAKRVESALSSLYEEGSR